MSTSRREIEKKIDEVMALIEKGDLDQAEGEAKQLLEKFPDVGATYTVLAVVKCWKREYQEVIPLAQKTVELYPRNHRATVVLFASLRQCKRYAEAFDEMVRYHEAAGPIAFYDEVIEDLLLELPEEDPDAYKLFRAKLKQIGREPGTNLG